MNKQETEDAIKALQAEIKVIKNTKATPALIMNEIYNINRRLDDLSACKRVDDQNWVRLKARVGALYGITTRMQQSKNVGDNYTQQCDCPSCLY